MWLQKLLISILEYQFEIELSFDTVYNFIRLRSLLAFANYYFMHNKKDLVMASRNDCEVVIGGKVITLSGSESEEYMQKVATYLNGKLQEFNSTDYYRRQPLEMQSILVQLNIADDYFKALDQINALQDEIEMKDKELYDLKHELITSQIKLESKDKMIKSYQGDFTKKR